MLPVYRTYVAAGRAGGPRCARRATLFARCCSELRAPREFVKRFQQTTPRGDGQGGRGHRLLPLRAPARPERGGRRSHPLRHLRGRVPPRQPRARRALPARPAHHPDARHEAKRRRAGPDRGAGGDGGRVGRAGVAAGARSSREDGGPSWSEAYLVFQTLVGAWPLEPRAARGLRGEGAARGEAEHELGRARRRATRARVRDWCRALYSNRRLPRRAGAVRGAGGARGRALGARPDAAEADRPGGARRLPGRRAVGAVAGGSRQPPPRRLGAPPRGAGGAAGRSGADAARRSSCS